MCRLPCSSPAAPSRFTLNSTTMSMSKFTAAALLLVVVTRPASITVPGRSSPSPTGSPARPNPGRTAALCGIVGFKPGFGVLPEQGVFPKYTAGVHGEGDTKMVISRGLGNSGFPIRVGNRPEIVVITLKSK